ncbi:venom carboxylesterase-6-like isoform X2 [Photinus pyralis]|nr:venom carboxylesterase-6-like isoform X2 [Photinus pyralis]
MDISPTPSYAVMVFFHGGGWLCGGGNSHWYGPDVLLDKDVVLVIPNYRLGALGFLSTGDEVVPGNNGLKDQSLALKWISENIVHFGGNPNKVTLFGESAGGASAHYHMLSPLSIGLFHGAISQSGTAHVPWALAKPGSGIRQILRLAEAVGCSASGTAEVVECLKTVDPYTMVSQDKVFMEWDIDPMIPFPPVIEPKLPGAFLTGHPTKIIQSGKSAQVPWITGLNTEDGALRAPGIFGNAHLMEDLDKNFHKILPISLFYKEACTSSDYISNQLRKFYLGNKKVDNSSRQAITDLFTDGWFLHGADESIRQHIKHTNQPVFYYLFGHHGVASFSQIFGDATQRYGVCHADELQYLFPVGDSLFPNQKPDELDRRMTDLMTDLWTNFAKYGDPTPELSYNIHNKWKPVKSVDDMEYYYIAGGGAHSAKGLLPERTQFWRNLEIKWDSMCAKDEL